MATVDTVHISPITVAMRALIMFAEKAKLGKSSETIRAGT
jgi:hypothetical protein